MAGRQHISAEIARRCVQIREFHRLVAADAGNRRFPSRVRGRERVDDARAELLLVVEHIMRDAELRGDIARVGDVTARAARALAAGRNAMVVELKRDADDLVALSGQKRRHDRRVDAARHGDDHAGLRRRLRQTESVDGNGHGRASSLYGREIEGEPQAFLIRASYTAME